MTSKKDLQRRIVSLEGHLARRSEIIGDRNQTIAAHADTIEQQKKQIEGYQLLLMHISALAHAGAGDQVVVDDDGKSTTIRPRSDWAERQQIFDELVWEFDLAKVVDRRLAERKAGRLHWSMSGEDTPR